MLSIYYKLQGIIIIMREISLYALAVILLPRHSDPIKLALVIFLIIIHGTPIESEIIHLMRI